MGKRGPAPTPTALKVVRGDRASRVNRHEAKPPVTPGPPRCPAWLSPEAKTIWRSLAKEMHKRGVLTSWDRETFAVFCVAVVMHRKAAEAVQASAILVKSDRGGLAKNPALQVMRDSAQTIRAFAQEFGLTPSARSGIELPEGDEFDAARRLLS